MSSATNEGALLQKFQIIQIRRKQKLTVRGNICDSMGKFLMNFKKKLCSDLVLKPPQQSGSKNAKLKQNFKVNSNVVKIYKSEALTNRIQMILISVNSRYLDLSYLE